VSATVLRHKPSALALVREQLAEGTSARKCHACGCFRQTVDAIGRVEPAAAALADALESARRALVPTKYDCLGCDVCFPAIAANALAEEYPVAATDLAACPTETPDARTGWPPLPGDYRVLRYGAPVAVCTLNDAALTAALASAAVDGLAIVGTMRTENLGIERLIKNTLANPNIRRLVLCGDDTQGAIGHLPGQTLLSLAADGVDDTMRIRGARGKRPVLKNVTRAEVEAFVKQIEITPMIGQTEVASIAERVRACADSAPPPFEGAPSPSAIGVLHATQPSRLVPDPAGYVVVYPDARRGRLLVEHFTNAGVLDAVIEGSTPAALYAAVIERGLVTRLDHAAYLGRELARAERSLGTGEPYIQDRAAGAADDEDADGDVSCGCSHECGG
jgi:tetrahydromethanopterin S-methyltransferase subunit A